MLMLSDVYPYSYICWCNVSTHLLSWHYDRAIHVLDHVRILNSGTNIRQHLCLRCLRNKAAAHACALKSQLTLVHKKVKVHIGPTGKMASSLARAWAAVFVFTTPVHEDHRTRILCNWTMTVQFKPQLYALCNSPRIATIALLCNDKPNEVGSHIKVQFNQRTIVHILWSCS